MDNEKKIEALLPLVYTSKGNQEPFDPLKIHDSLIVETGISPSLAIAITQTTIRKLIASKPTFLSGPMIREMVCDSLVVHGCEIERLKYTRIGIPLHDLIQILYSNTSLEKQDREIALRIVKECHNVRDLINKLEKEKEKEK